MYPENAIESLQPAQQAAKSPSSTANQFCSSCDKLKSGLMAFQVPCVLLSTHLGRDTRLLHAIKLAEKSIADKAEEGKEGNLMAASKDFRLNPSKATNSAFCCKGKVMRKCWCQTRCSVFAVPVSSSYHP